MIQSDITIINKLGLHARASAKLAQLANQFSSSVRVEYKEKTIDCKSIMAIMLLAAGIGSQLRLIVDGDDEQLAHSSIVELFANRFGEEE